MLREVYPVPMMTLYPPHHSLLSLMVRTLTFYFSFLFYIYLNIIYFCFVSQVISPGLLYFKLFVC